MKTTFFTLVLFCAMHCVFAQIPPAKPPEAKSKPEAAILADQLAAKGSPQQSEALARVREMLTNDPKKANDDLRNKWLKALIAGGRYDDAAELAFAAILYQPSHTIHVQMLQELRTRALLAAGHKSQALANAKSLFNVSSMSNTADALALISDCLQATDPAAADRFREQQIAGAATSAGTSATTQPAVAMSPPSSLAPSPSILAAINIDPTPYAQAIKNQTQNDYNGWTALGNLLLLADNPTEAKAAFDKAYPLASEAQLPAATESLARVLKAQDATIGRANAWILSLRTDKPSPDPATNTPQTELANKPPKPKTKKPKP